MTRLLGILPALLFGPGIALAAGDQPDVGADLAKAQECKECHGPDGIDLAGMQQAALIEKMKTIRAGETDHDPVLDGVSDANLAEIAKILVSSD